METKHTTGPWAVYKSRGNSRLRVMSDAVPYDVATMNHAGSEEAEAANANLIAAAPELLEALRGLVNCHTGAAWQTAEAQRRWWLAAASAIAKAEGRA